MANVNAGSKKHEFSSMIGAPSSDAGHIAEPAGSSGVVRRRASRNGAIMFGAVVFAVAFCLVAALWWALSGEVSLPALVVAAALFEGGWGGGLFGLAAGILSDLFFGSQTVLFTVLFPVTGFIAGFLGDFYLNKRLFTYCILGAAALLIAAVAQMFALLVAGGQGTGALWGTALLQTLWSLPFLFPSYYLCRSFPWRSSRETPTPYK